MKFETLRMMAQDYADRHKEPQSLPVTSDTMTYAYQRICQGEDPWTALGDFSNAWYGYAKHIRPDLIEAYQWMVDFVDELVAPTDEHAAGKLSIALNGKGAFRRFKDTLHGVDDQWLQAWYQWRDKQLKAAVDEWLKRNSEVSHSPLLPDKTLFSFGRAPPSSPQST
jgi:hypothetical protein